MKSTGIVRNVDELGRVVIPVEIREKFNIAERDPLEVFVEGSTIILKKYEQNCVFCGSEKKLQQYNDKLICSNCIQKIIKTEK